MIKGIFRATLINGVALFVVSQSVSGFHLAYGLKSLVVVTLVFTTFHLLVKPVLKIVLGPLNFATLGLLFLALDVAILYALTIFLPQVSFSAWFFPGLEYFGFTIPAYDFNALGVTIISALIVNFIRTFLNYLAT